MHLAVDMSSVHQVRTEVYELFSGDTLPGDENPTFLLTLPCGNQKLVSKAPFARWMQNKN
jgi:hypothetical protein